MDRLQYLESFLKPKPYELSGVAKLFCADLTMIVFAAAVSVIGLFGLFKEQIVCTASTHKLLGDRFIDTFCWANNTFTEEIR